MRLAHIVDEAVGESSQRSEQDSEEAPIEKAPEEPRDGASTSKASRFPGVDFIEGNAILNEDLLRRHFHHEKSHDEKSLNSILNSLKYATSLEGQVRFRALLILYFRTNSHSSYRSRATSSSTALQVKISNA